MFLGALLLRTDQQEVHRDHHQHHQQDQHVYRARLARRRRAACAWASEIRKLIVLVLPGGEKWSAIMPQGHAACRPRP